MSRDSFTRKEASRYPGWYVQYSDGSLQGPWPGGETGARKQASLLSMPGHPVKAVHITGGSKRGGTVAKKRSKSSPPAGEPEMNFATLKRYGKHAATKAKSLVDRALGRCKCD